MAITEPTINDFVSLVSDQCDGAVVAYHFAQSHKARVDALEGILEYSYISLIENRHLNQCHKEDALTVQIVEQLKCYQIQASHDTQTGGHCDILVRAKPHFAWIAEAKIHKDYKWLISGFQQLTTRYGIATAGRENGEIIIYCRRQNAVKVIKNWKKRLTSLHPSVKIEEDRVEECLWFRSSHPCESTGRKFYTRHKIIPLYWKPTNLS